MSAYRAHDLLRVDTAALQLPEDAPAWVMTALKRAPWVVVRRAVSTSAGLPCGVRGIERGQRYALTVPPRAVHTRCVPEELTDKPTVRDMPALAALTALKPHLSGLRWGPTGSVAFELASGVPTVTATSDLDIVIRLDTLGNTGAELLRTITEHLCTVSVRVDCQVELPVGAIALGELLSDTANVLVRTPDGPKLVATADLCR